MMDIDPVKYGVLWQKVENMTDKVDKLEENMETLIALANKGRGGLWMAMAFVSVISSVIGYISHWIGKTN
jgi:hypothetical protein